MTSFDPIKHYKVNRNLAGIEDFPTRKAVEELGRAVEQLQGLAFGARAVELDGLPKDGELSEQLNGQFIRITSKGVRNPLHVIQHKLGHVPQGCIFIRQRTSLNECIIEGDEAFGGIDAATDKMVTFIIGDPAGSVVVGILI